MACQFCHIPFKREDASLSIDNATTGGTIDYPTSAFLSTDPQHPDKGARPIYGKLRHVTGVDPF